MKKLMLVVLALLALAAPTLVAFSAPAAAFETTVKGVPGKYQGKWYFNESRDAKTNAYTNACPANETCGEIVVGPKSYNVYLGVSCKLTSGWATNTLSEIKFACGKQTKTLTFSFDNDQLLVTQK